MVKYPYTVEKQAEDNYFVQFLDFPTGFTESQTALGAIDLAQDMLKGLVEAYKEDGLALPKASPVGSLDFVEI